MIVPLDVARVALRRALETRRRAGVDRSAAVCVYDLAEALGVEVRFQALDSLAGMYSGPPHPVIVIGSRRPAGYRTLTCGHELGHHAFGHGDRVDEYVQRKDQAADDPEERLANLFGYFLLMPEAAVSRAFSVRGWNPVAPTAQQVYIIAGHLGVGYEALVQQLRWSLRLLHPEHADALLRARPSQVRAELLGSAVSGDVYVVDEMWTDRAVDLTVDDYAILPAGAAVEGFAAEVLEQTSRRVVIRATRRGLARLDIAARRWASYLRVMPREYTGLSIHRHLEDPDADQ